MQKIFANPSISLLKVARNASRAKQGRMSAVKRGQKGENPRNKVKRIIRLFERSPIPAAQGSLSGNETTT